MASWRSGATRLVAIAAVVCMVALAACGGSPSNGPGGGNGGGSTTPPKAKPTALPTITQAFCQSILTVAEANQAMTPATPATTLRLDTPPQGGGSCNYEYAPYQAVVSVIFLAALTSAQQSQPIASHIPSSQASVVVNSAVSGVGDQAQYVATSDDATGQTINTDALDVIYGAVLFRCSRSYFGQSAAAADQTGLTTVCKLVVSRL